MGTGLDEEAHGAHVAEPRGRVQRKIAVAVGRVRACTASQQHADHLGMCGSAMQRPIAVLISSLNVAAALAQ